MTVVSPEVVRALTSHGTTALDRKLAMVVLGVGARRERDHCKGQNGQGLATGWVWRKLTCLQRFGSSNGFGSP